MAALESKIIAILGLAFKSNTDDVRESASIEMIESILEKGGYVNAFDPVANDSMKNISDIFTKFPEEACKDADGVVIMTEWNEFRGISLKYLKSLLKAPILLDTHQYSTCQEVAR